ncbi:NADPH-dependent FMN reductase [Alkalihalobacillus pseudalcaliphilus]|uniref:NADPH-dependent FMN reductase n=1 Tax=Alkalihalobacillus pseudalcaliphilus TaxID=79884 RepID=UPI00064DD620|nr:NADPH-dependent FMN reductase [Alkalihalobacillus pseudalcaliphilus]KMK76502.1 FMN reductase [Alkalihalobacillus pseudalcaliphilus]
MGNILIISGSPNKGSRLQGLIKYTQQYFVKEGVKTDIIHVHDLPAEALIQAQFNNEKVKRFHKQVEKADKIIVASQVYKASFTGILKTYLDLLPQNAFKGKPILPLVIGGSLAHLLMVDYSFKPVLSALGAKSIYKGIFVVETEVSKDLSHEFVINKVTKERLDELLLPFIE